MPKRITFQGFRYIIQRFGLLALFAVCLFSAGGSWEWARGWATIGVSFFCELVLTGFLVCLAPTMIIGIWAMVENEHFEQFVRIQTDRNHRVVTTGPYKIVRHPGYLAGILGTLAGPLMLGSVWSIIPACLIVVLFVWRTAREDRILIKELEGYLQYTEQTPYRLIPFVW